MGLDVNGTRFLLYAREKGVSFEKTAMIGRQSLLIDAITLQTVLGRFGFDLATEKAAAILDASDGYAESFLGLLGASDICSFDVSDYENATHVHDFNEPIGNEFKNRFSVVLDGGTLEHVFNYPIAIKNCMEMVCEGGHFLGIVPANNYFGHGFYQFSPELFFRIFTSENGFELEQVTIFEETPSAPWYEVSDPDEVKERVTLINDQQCLLLIIAKKVKIVEIFAKPPQQSDYSVLWRSANGKPKTNSAVRTHPSALGSFARLPLSAARRLKIKIDRSFGALNRRKRHFRKIDPNPKN
jgi:hypothetical protein